MPNAWITHVKQFAADNNIFFKKRSSSIIYIYIMPNAWITHVKQFAADNN